MRRKGTLLGEPPPDGEMVKTGFLVDRPPYFYILSFALWML